MISLGIFAPIKNEHDFINQWLEYHINYGFDKIYLFVDNRYSIQDDYLDIIDNTFLKYIKFIYYTNINISDHSDDFINEYINNNFNIFEEDWLLMGSIDMFVYINNINIKEYINTIDKKCSQILIPWFSVYNLDDLPYDNLLKNINNYYTNIRKETSSLINIKKMKFKTSRHIFIAKDYTDLILLNNSYYNYDCSHNIYNFTENFFIKNYNYIFDNNNNLFNYNIPIHIHFINRNYDEIIIKDIYSWNNNNKIDNNINIIKNIITNKDIITNNNNIKKNNKTSISDRLNIYNLRNNNSNSLFFFNKININIFDNINLYFLNTSIYYDKYISKLLFDINISIKKYNKWKKNIILNKNISDIKKIEIVKKDKIIKNKKNI